MCIAVALACALSTGLAFAGATDIFSLFFGLIIQIVAWAALSFADSVMGPLFKLTTLTTDEIITYIPGFGESDTIGNFFSQAIGTIAYTIAGVLICCRIVTYLISMANGEKVESVTKLIWNAAVGIVATIAGKHFLTLIFDEIITPLSSALAEGIDGDMSVKYFQNLGKDMIGLSSEVVPFDISNMPLLLLVFFVSFLIWWNMVKLVLECAQRYIICIFTIQLSPLAFATASSETTRESARNWLDMFWSQCVLLILNIWVVGVGRTALGNIVAFASGDNIAIWGFATYAYLKMAQQLDDMMAKAGFKITRMNGIDPVSEAAGLFNNVKGIYHDLTSMGQLVSSKAREAYSAASDMFGTGYEPPLSTEGVIPPSTGEQGALPGVTDQEQYPENIKAEQKILGITDDNYKEELKHGRLLDSIDTEENNKAAKDFLQKEGLVDKDAEIEGLRIDTKTGARIGTAITKDDTGKVIRKQDFKISNDGTGAKGSVSYDAELGKGGATITKQDKGHEYKYNMAKIKKDGKDIWRASLLSVDGQMMSDIAPDSAFSSDFTIPDKKLKEAGANGEEALAVDEFTKERGKSDEKKWRYDENLDKAAEPALTKFNKSQEARAAFSTETDAERLANLQNGESKTDTVAYKAAMEDYLKENGYMSDEDKLVNSHVNKETGAMMGTIVNPDGESRDIMVSNSGTGIKAEEAENFVKKANNPNMVAQVGRDGKTFNVSMGESFTAEDGKQLRKLEVSRADGDGSQTATLVVPEDNFQNNPMQTISRAFDNKQDKIDDLNNRTEDALLGERATQYLRGLGLADENSTLENTHHADTEKGFGFTGTLTKRDENGSVLSQKDISATHGENGLEIGTPENGYSYERTSETEAKLKANGKDYSLKLAGEDKFGNALVTVGSSSADGVGTETLTIAKSKVDEAGGDAMAVTANAIKSGTLNAKQQAKMDNLNQSIDSKIDETKQARRIRNDGLAATFEGMGLDTAAARIREESPDNDAGPKPQGEVDNIVANELRSAGVLADGSQVSSAHSEGGHLVYDESYQDGNGAKHTRRMSAAKNETTGKVEAMPMPEASHISADGTQGSLTTTHGDNSATTGTSYNINYAGTHEDESGNMVHDFNVERPNNPGKMASVSLSDKEVQAAGGSPMQAAMKAVEGKKFADKASAMNFKQMNQEADELVATSDDMCRYFNGHGIPCPQEGTVAGTENAALSQNAWDEALTNHLHETGALAPETRAEGAHLVNGQLEYSAVNRADNGQIQAEKSQAIGEDGNVVDTGYSMQMNPDGESATVSIGDNAYTIAAQQGEGGEIGFTVGCDTYEGTSIEGVHSDLAVPQSVLDGEQGQADGMFAAAARTFAADENAGKQSLDQKAVSEIQHQQHIEDAMNHFDMSDEERAADNQDESGDFSYNRAETLDAYKDYMLAHQENFPEQAVQILKNGGCVKALEPDAKGHLQAKLESVGSGDEFTCSAYAFTAHSVDGALHGGAATSDYSISTTGQEQGTVVIKNVGKETPAGTFRLLRTGIGENGKTNWEIKQTRNAKGEKLEKPIVKTVTMPLFNGKPVNADDIGRYLANSDCTEFKRFMTQKQVRISPQQPSSLDPRTGGRAQRQNYGHDYRKNNK